MSSKHFEQPEKLFLDHYRSNVVSCRRLSGDVNETYLIESSGEKIIFQKLSPIFNEMLLADFVVYSSHLAKAGWTVPEIILSKTGGLFIVDDNQKLWRAVTYIESTGTPSKVDLYAFGDIIGHFHESLSTLHYQPLFSLSHFHDTQFYFHKLQKIYRQLPASLLSQAEIIFRMYENLKSLPEVPTQLIHGDARVGNILFNHDTPFTIIDFDTIMLGTAWIELGDSVRSLLEQNVIKNQPSDFEVLKQFTNGYLSRSTLSFSEKEFFEEVMNATQLIALELSMRFLIDIVEDYYFVWENTPYKSRLEHNDARVLQQLEIIHRIDKNS